MKAVTALFVLALAIVGITTSLGLRNQAAAAGSGLVLPAPGTVRTYPQPMNHQQMYYNPLALTTFGGKFVYNFTITVKSTLPVADVIVCNGTASFFDTSGKTIEESASVAAARAGGTATCSVTIPYSWALAGGSTDMVSLAYTISVPEPGTGMALPQRLSTQGIASIHVPANGSTTTETIAATI